MCRHLGLQVARRSHQALLLHMTRFVYSPTGALKWKKDVNEYAEILSTYQVRQACRSVQGQRQLQARHGTAAAAGGPGAGMWGTARRF